MLLGLTSMIEAVKVGVGVNVLVGVLVGVLVEVLVGVSVGVFVSVLVGVLLGVLVGVLVDVLVAVLVGLGVPFTHTAGSLRNGVKLTPFVTTSPVPPGLLAWVGPVAEFQ